MELDELKSHINQKLSTDHIGRSSADFADLLKRKTGTIIDKLKRSLWIEIISCIVIILGFGYVGLFNNYRSFRIYFSVFAVISIVFLFILIYLLKKTKQLSATSLPIKSNLQLIVKIIEEFIKRYFQFTMVLIPVCIIFSFVLGYTEPAKIDFFDEITKGITPHKGKVIIFVIVYLVILSFGAYYFTKWYLKHLYGRYVNQLKECISELSEA